MKKVIGTSVPVGLLLLALDASAQIEASTVEVPTADSALVTTQESGPAEQAAAPAPDGASGLDTIAVQGPQDEAAEETKEAGGPRSRLVEEIIVTAQKREENLQSVPISIQAFSGDNLDARGVTDATSLGRITPGLTITQAVGFTLIYLRGVGSDAFLLGDPSVAYYIDNIYFPFSQGLAQEFGAVDRIEVLKGPQGTLFGRNAVGGAVNVLTKAPDFSEARTQVESEVANYNVLKTRVNTNIPISDELAFSLSAFYNTQEFYQGGRINVSANSNGESLDPIVSKAARLKVRWAPTEDIDATLAGLLYRSDGAGTLFQTNAFPSPLARTLGVTPQTGYRGELDEGTDQSIDNRVVYGDIKWSLPWANLRLLGSDQLIKTAATYDYDGSPRPLVGFEGPKLFADVQSAEFQILSNDSSPEWLKWILGSYYFRSESGYDGGLHQRVSLVNDLRGALLNFVPIDQLPSFLQANLPSGNVVVYGTLGTKSIAYFSQVTADLTDWMSLTLGGRYQEEKRYIVEAYNGLETMDGGSTPIFPLNPDSNLLSHTTKSFSPKASIDFHVFDDTLIYASYQEATKSGTYNPLKLLQAVDYVKPEKTRAYEVGVKRSFFDGLMTFAGAGFYYDISNLQVQYVSLLNGGVVTFETARAAEVKGMDFDISAILFPDLVDDLAVTFSGAYIDAQFTDFANGSGFSESTGIFSPNNDFTGNHISRSPKFTTTLTLAKTWQIPGGPLEVGGDYYYNSGFYFTAQNSDVARQRKYDLLGVRVSYLYEPWNLRATVYGNNILDEKYQIGVLQADFGTNVSLGAPVTYGLRLAWEF